MKIFFLLASQPLLAHQPSFSDGDHDTPLSAYRILDPDLSIVVYREVSCAQPVFWLTYQADHDYPLFFQLGVPQIDRLEGYQPTIAVVHPDLPAPTEELPFDLPDGMGIEIWHSTAVAAPADFFEPFTQTHSWIWIEETMRLPADGQGYLVAWDPAGWTGKLWVAVGTVEDFGNVDWSEAALWSEAVNDFHETGRYSTVPDVEEQWCGADGDAASYQTDSGITAEVGGSDMQGSTQQCGHVHLTSLLLAGLGALLSWGRRRPILTDGG